MCCVEIKNCFGYLQGRLVTSNVVSDFALNLSFNPFVPLNLLLILVMQEKSQVLLSLISQIIIINLMIGNPSKHSTLLLVYLLTWNVHNPKPSSKSS